MQADRCAPKRTEAMRLLLSRRGDAATSTTYLLRRIT
jgi:hypothetical protein